MREAVPAESSIGRFRLVAVAVLALVAVACAIGVPEREAEQQPSPTGPFASESVRASRPSVDEFQADLNGAVQVAEDYWLAKFNAAGARFTPVRQIIAYRRDGEVTCGGQPVPRNNAVYCSDGDFIAYDVGFAVEAFTHIGDAFLYYLLGHEYAHAVQIRMGIQYRFTIEQELQADCMAGAYLGDSVRGGVLRVQQGDLDEFRRGLLAVGDNPDIPWFAPGAHGTPVQRTAAFFAGYENSLRACQTPIV